jgi:hypothetical protein
MTDAKYQRLPQAGDTGVLAWASEESSGLNALIKLPVWLINDNSCVDIKASIEHNATPATITS